MAIMPPSADPGQALWKQPSACCKTIKGAEDKGLYYVDAKETRKGGQGFMALHGSPSNPNSVNRKGMLVVLRKTATAVTADGELSLSIYNSYFSQIKPCSILAVPDGCNRSGVLKP